MVKNQEYVSSDIEESDWGKKNCEGRKGARNTKHSSLRSHPHKIQETHNKINYGVEWIRKGILQSLGGDKGVGWKVRERNWDQ